MAKNKKRSKSKALFETIGTGIVAPSAMGLIEASTGTTLASMPTESQIVSLAGIVLGAVLFYGADEMNVRRLPEGTQRLVLSSAEEAGRLAADNTRFVTPDGNEKTKNE